LRLRDPVLNDTGFGFQKDSDWILLSDWFFSDWISLVFLSQDVGILSFSGFSRTWISFGFQDSDSFWFSQD
jgi:hypothetical protein